MRRNTFHDEAPKKPKPKGLGLDGNALSKRQEKRVAKRSGGKRTPASGSLPFAKGDVDARLNLIECKTTGKKSLRIEQRWLAKITREARLKHKDAGLTVSFSEMPSDVDQDWIMIPFTVFQRLIDAERAQFE
jgi:hypothetical protein